MASLLWITFDLGVRGDYQGMYEFLDAHGAKECGDSAAVLTYEYEKDLIIELTKEIKRDVKLDRRSRVYVVFPDQMGKYKGRFLAGKRKPAPWSGYAASEAEEEDVGE